MLLLFETPAGFALFKVLDEGKLSKVEDLGKEFATPDSARQVVKLKAFSKFENTSEALSAATLLIDSKPSKGLRKFLRSHCEGDILAVADSKLGNTIKEKLQIECVHNNAVMELMRGVRSQLTELISGLASQDLAPMSLGLSHSLSRYKLKFSPDKVDTMIIQAISLLDDLDKELNTYAMRVREWYGWHFPELAKIIQDNILYAKTVKLMGNRTNAAKLDFSEILQEEVETELKEAAMISMGTEVSDLDLENIKDLCNQVLSLAEYRAQLYDYLKSRMNTIAPNLTALVGELVGARLIAHGGSLLNLAKQPGSTVQILGAEKALFRALKTKHATPKYGLIYHASLIGQAAPKHKGKISRSLAAKAALAIRCDALGDGEDNSMGLENRAKLEARLRNLEGKELGRSVGSAKGKPKIEFYDKDRKKGSGGLITPAKTYNPAADSILGLTESLSKKDKYETLPSQTHVPSADEEQKSKKKKKKKNDAEDAEMANGINGAEPESEAVGKKEKKKKKKHLSDDAEMTTEQEIADGGEKKKKRKHTELPNEQEDADAGEKKKKKRKHAEPDGEGDATPAKKKDKKKKKKSED
ncbi:probable nucleolar protein 5-2 [Sesamum indicum]|uniref:Probable nucleolar protein 5-2 n=1 Tax=Sesamum indicum TaxID=4182 RepID=A0A6I9UHR6_SESIN|nr:probable nucleolar protein 5-2 [Sesamum indicum]XP_011099779.1 probable nucleolar protein 5-2 [Sesamum indicum]XP_011099780.1 probable nucleolar protein 5-2 [Sesamum indicum]